MKEPAQKRFLNKINELIGSKGNFGIEVCLDSTKNYTAQVVDIEGGLDINKDPIGFDSKLDALKSDYFKDFSKRYGRENVKVIKF